MKTFEGPKLDRDLEKDKRLFEEAVNNVSVSEIPTAFDESATRDIEEGLKRDKVFILGEMHGVKENVDVIYTLFKKFGFRQLALEWKPDLKQVAEMFLISNELNFNAIKDSPDGRITAGHFALLKKLKSEEMLDGLICFDGGSGGYGWNARDESMAKRILDAISSTPTLVVAGNLHTKTEMIIFDNEPGEQHPMGEHVKRKIPNVASGKIEYLSGQYNNYGIKKFGEISSEEPAPEARFFRDEKGVYIFRLPKAHAAIVPNPKEKI